MTDERLSRKKEEGKSEAQKLISVAQPIKSNPLG